ncbi:MAG: TIGR04551 family protein [Myxococcales bacterium FL481]|nr:MAG: TIGR04551 family protein [Myxococcales bacterium FL481]
MTMLWSPDAMALRHAYIAAQPRGAGVPGGPAGGAAGPGQAGQQSEEEDGPAEEAPKDKSALLPISRVPAVPEGQRRLQLFEAHGYLRMRADYFHRLHLGLNQAVNGEPGSKFVPPVDSLLIDEDGLTHNASCYARLAARDVSASKIQKRCERRQGLSSANMRFRFSPTLHISENVKIHSTIDALDNLVLGSTPDSFVGDNPWAPIDLFTRTQMPPNEGLNSFQDSLTVKRAWGHMHFGWGLDVKFGRMPHHWGLGVVANDGNGYDRQSQDDLIRSLDMDFGDSIDTLRIGFDLGEDPRRMHHLAVSWDWASSGPTTAQLLGSEWASGNRVGQDYSFDKFDNVFQVSASLQRRDSPAMLRRKLASGTAVLNYGVIGWLRMQDVARPIGAPGLGSDLGDNADAAGLEQDGIDPAGDPLGNGETDADGNTAVDNYTDVRMWRRAQLVTPDVWMRVNWRTLRVELEVAGSIGSFRHRDLSITPADNGWGLDDLVLEDDFETSNIRQLGYALEFKYGLFDDRFHIGFDQGFASGDDVPPHDYDVMSPLANTNGIDDARTLSAFRFNPAYSRDLLLFREVMGTTANAAYFKPWIAFFFFQRNASFRIDAQYALAANKPGTPSGEGRSYGLELDGAIRYHDVRDPIFVQAQYGVMFPFGAFDEDASAAQSIQLQLGIGF